MAVVEHVLKLRDEASGALDDVADSAEGAEVGLGGVSTSMAALATAAIAAGAAIFAAVKYMADLKNELNDLSVRTGISSRTLAGLKLAAEGSGLSLQELSSGLSMFAGRMAMAKEGTGETAKAFEQLGISVADIDGNLRSSEDVLVEFLTELDKIPDATTRSALATQALGRSGTMLLQALAGDASLEDFSRIAAQLGPDLEGASEGAADLQRSLALLKTVAEGALDKVMQAFGGEGGIASLIDFMVPAIAAAGAAVSAFISNTITSWGLMINLLVFLWTRVAKEISLTDLLFASPEELAEMASNVSGAVVKGLRSADKAMMAAYRDPIEEAIAAIDAANLAVDLGIDFGGAGGAGEESETEAEKKKDAATVQAATNIRSLADATMSATDRLAAFATETFAVGSAIAASLLTGDVGAAVGSAAGAVSQVVKSGFTTVATALASVNWILGAVFQVLGNVFGEIFDAVGQAISTITRIGQLGAGGVEEKLDQFREDFIAGIDALPEILGEVLPEFAAEFIKALIPALREFGLIVMRGWGQAFRNLDHIIYRAMMRVYRTLARLGTRPARDPASPTVARARAAVLGSGPVQRGRALVGGGGITVNIQGVVAENVRSLTREIRNRLGAAGQGLSLGAR